MIQYIYQDRQYIHLSHWLLDSYHLFVMVNAKSNTSWSPVQSVLKVSNLPANITALQIRHLLSYVRDNWTSDGLRKVYSGVTV